MPSPLAYLNGFAPFSECTLPLSDAGFASGAAVVDNARTFRHRFFRGPDHRARFRRDCAACRVPLDASDAQLTAIAEELIAHNAALLPPGGELQVVTFATPGPLGVYRGDAANGPPMLGMLTYPLPFARYRRFFTEGATLALVPGPDHGTSVLPPTVKHRSRMFWHVADSIARERTGNAGALALSCTHGAVGETSVANVLAVLDGAVVSPPRDDVLHGVSLRVTAELCAALGLPFVRAPLMIADLERASELLLAGTAFCVAGVRTLDAHAVPWPGPVFDKLLAAWSDLVGQDIAQPFLDAA